MTLLILFFFLRNSGSVTVTRTNLGTEEYLLRRKPCQRGALMFIHPELGGKKIRKFLIFH